MKRCLCFFILFLITPNASKAEVQCHDVEAILKTQIEIISLWDKYKNSSMTINTPTCRNFFYETYIEDHYSIICECVKNSHDLTQLFIDFSIAHDNFADESISWCLGQLYLSEKENLLSVLSSYRHKNIEYIYKGTVFGVQNHIASSGKHIDLNDIKEKFEGIMK